MIKSIKTILIVAAIALSSASAEGFHSLYELEGSPFTTFVARKAGDILTVVIKEKAKTKDDGLNKLDLIDEANFSLGQFFISPFNPFNGLTKAAGGGDSLSIDYTTQSKHNAIAQNMSNMEIKTTIQVRLIEEVSEGQFIIRGHKNVYINGKERVVYVSGVIRQIDISNHNMIFSDQIADAIVEIDGEVAHQDTEPGFFMNLFNWVF